MINWRDLKDPSQVIANIAVTLTLVATLWFSIAENRRAEEHANSEKSALETQYFYEQLRNGRTLSQEYQKGVASVEDVFTYFQTSYLLHAYKVFEEKTWSFFVSDICTVLKNDPKFRAAWSKQDRTTYFADFIKFMDGMANDAKCADGQD